MEASLLVHGAGNGCSEVTSVPMGSPSMLRPTRCARSATPSAPTRLSGARPSPRSPWTNSGRPWVPCADDRLVYGLAREPRMRTDGALVHGDGSGCRCQGNRGGRCLPVSHFPVFDVHRRSTVPRAATTGAVKLGHWLGRQAKSCCSYAAHIVVFLRLTEWGIGYSCHEPGQQIVGVPGSRRQRDGAGTGCRGP